jgi:hypothetical protein
MEHDDALAFEIRHKLYRVIAYIIQATQMQALSLQKPKKLAAVPMARGLRTGTWALPQTL